MTPRFEIYKATDGWRWRLRSGNGRILASGEAFTSRRHAERAIDTLTRTVVYDEPDRVLLPPETAGRNRQPSR